MKSKLSFDEVLKLVQEHSGHMLEETDLTVRRVIAKSPNLSHWKIRRALNDLEKAGKVKGFMTTENGKSAKAWRPL